MENCNLQDIKENLNRALKLRNSNEDDVRQLIITIYDILGYLEGKEIQQNSMMSNQQDSNTEIPKRKTRDGRDIPMF